MAIDYLRLSLTDRCNLNCIYCTPLEKGRYLAREELLTHEEIARAAGAFVKAGVKKIRFTGGEPLIKKNVVELAGMIKAIPGLKELALTTNGVCLAALAGDLRKAGVDCVNISLDTLKRQTFKRITGADRFNEVWSGVQKSLRAGFRRVKLNVVIMNGINDGEIAEFAGLSVEYPLTVRFIEFFPVNTRSVKLTGALLPTAEVKRRIERIYGRLLPAGTVKGGGPARGYSVKGAKGGMGFISGRSGYFCGSCNRVRMDCSGNVYPCLFSPPVHNLRGRLRSGAGCAELARDIKNIFLVKSEYRKDSASAGHIEMSSIGG
ncbi:MAG: cyclic pyranopterin phosphate synthase MoaA [Elusimicrobia bacterium GWA2_56_46]|nr:MAG: cyclic pyranopterin phosphate synthase MoaA [Elusimicrobia bacterium GWA2_56_46]OGR56139.1 MAG: cyclic pyranopterin phosphate synthase MoaA [Elusimicrobia bacterium GWC2_56_31]HBB67341.1 GTP 3',8-cyclase MoaA [Elusimicrobiota bacterium]HBW23088.1 GTP 3',8-cyclase MoaA [Elusimicrobiota bacterium]